MNVVLCCDYPIIFINAEDMADCNHKEADTRIAIHVYDALQRGAKKVMVGTVDTDVAVILIGQCYNIMSQHSEVRDHQQQAM